MTGLLTPTCKLTDQFSRLKYVDFLRHRDETVEALCIYIQDVSIPYGWKAHRPPSDGGGEYVAGYFREYCKWTGIQHELRHLTRRKKMGGRSGTGVRCAMSLGVS